MLKFTKGLFVLDKQPRKGLLPLELVVMAYLITTLVAALITYADMVNPDAVIWGRVRIAFITIALWGVYRMIPCRFTLFARITVQLALLSWWYPDTYEINRIFPNFDYIFAQWEQSLFGCQPALLFSEALPWPVVSELMDMGYASYYPMIIVVIMFYFFYRYEEYERASFIVLTSFFIYYFMFLLIPAAGPTFYYNAVGVSDISHGVFPNIIDYFNYCRESLPSPGYKDGFFYQLVEQAKAAGERPTAAFPSSHVGVSTVLMLLVWHAKNRRMFYIMLPFYILLCLSTVYIQAHYAIDAIAGLVSGVVIYVVLMAVAKKFNI